MSPRLWKIRVKDSSKEYIYVDRNGSVNKRKVQLLWWHTYKNDLYDRPELEVTYIRATDIINISAAKFMTALLRTPEFIEL